MEFESVGINTGTPRWMSVCTFTSLEKIPAPNNIIAATITASPTPRTKLICICNAQLIPLLTIPV